MIRSTLAASLCLSVIVACDGRGVVQMKAHQYTASERAQAREMMGLKGDDKQTLTSRFHKQRRPKAQTEPQRQQPATPNTDLPEDPEIKPDDKAVSKSFWEKMDPAGTQASTNVANLRALVAEKLGKLDDDVLERLAGLSIENKSQFGTTMFDLHAIITLRGRDQALHLLNQRISPADAKDLVYGTSNVQVENFTASNVQERGITTDELLISSFCLEPDGNACKHAYLTIQLGQNAKGKWITAVFELDAQLNIVNSNIRLPGQKEPSYYDVLERFSKMTQSDLSKHDKPSAHMDAIKKEVSQPPAEQVLRNGKPTIALKNDLMEISRTKGQPFQLKPVEKKVIGPVAKTVENPAAKPATAALATPPAAPVSPEIAKKVATPPDKAAANITSGVKTKNDLLAISRAATDKKKAEHLPAAPFTFEKPAVEPMDLSNSKVNVKDKAEPAKGFFRSMLDKVNPF